MTICAWCQLESYEGQRWLLSAVAVLLVTMQKHHHLYIFAFKPWCHCAGLKSVESCLKECRVQMQKLNHIILPNAGFQSTEPDLGMSAGGWF